MSALSNSYLPYFSNEPSISAGELFSNDNQTIVIPDTSPVLLICPTTLSSSEFFISPSPGILQFLGSSTNHFMISYTICLTSTVDVLNSIYINLRGLLLNSGSNTITTTSAFVRELTGSTIENLNYGDMISLYIGSSAPNTTNCFNVKLSAYELL